MHNIQLVKIQPEEWLAASSELNPASCLVTGCGEARGMGYWAATQVKGLSPEIFIVPEADVVVLTEGSTLIADSPIGTWQGDASPAGSETVARYQMDIMGTRETQSVLLTGVCAIKPINGKTVQTTLWESDQFIVPEKQGNACRGKGLAGARWPGRDTPSILRDGQGVSTKLWSITLRERRGCTPEEPDEGKLQVRFCEGAHSNRGAITSKKRCAMGSTRQKADIDSTCNNIALAYKNRGNYEKSYEYIKRALELQKEKNVVYDIAKTKVTMAEIYYSDPEKPASVDSIIKCLNEALETFEKIGHVRGTLKVLSKIGDIYLKEEDFKSVVAHYQRAAAIYSSLNQQSEEAELNAKIGLCYVKLKDFTNARSYLEKNLLSGHCGIEDKLSLVEVYLNNGDYNEASDLSNKLITADAEEISDDKRYLALLFSSISSVLLNKVDDASNYLKKIGEFEPQKYNINWDFSDIESVLDKTGESKQLFIDAITLLKGDVNYPIIRVKDVKILSEEAGKQAEVFHPFTGSLTITKDDENLKEIMQKLRAGEKIDFDTPEIMGMKRNKALLIFGFLFSKGFLDCKNPDEQKFDLKLSEKWLKIKI